MLDPGCGGEEFGRSPLNKPAHQSVWAVPRHDLGDPSRRRGRRSVRCRRHVAVGQGVHQERFVEDWELAFEFRPQAAFFCLQQRESVVGNETNYPLIGLVLIAHEAGAIERMEACRCEPRRVADVVQEGCGDEQFSIAIEQGA